MGIASSHKEEVCREGLAQVHRHQFQIWPRSLPDATGQVRLYGTPQEGPQGIGQQRVPITPYVVVCISCARTGKSAIICQQLRLRATSTVVTFYASCARVVVK